MGSAADIVREGFTALRAGGVEALIPYVHPEFEGTVPPELSAEPAAYRGHAGVRHYFDLFDEVIEDLDFDFTTVHDEAGDYVVADGRISGRGKESGAPFEMAIACVITLRDDQIVGMEPYRELEEAVLAARERAGQAA